MNGIGQRAPVIHYAILEHHERHAGVPRGMGDRCELLGAPEALGRYLHACAAIEHRFQSGVQTGFDTGTELEAAVAFTALDVSAFGAAAVVLGRGVLAGAVATAGGVAFVAVASADGTAARELSADILSRTDGPTAMPTANAPKNPAVRAAALPTVMFSLPFSNARASVRQSNENLQAR